MISGMLIGALLTPCNIYSGLNIGWSFNISIIALLLTAGFWALLARLRIAARFDSDEANIAQTAASSSEHHLRRPGRTDPGVGDAVRQQYAAFYV